VSSLLVVAGEASGDRAAAAVVARLAGVRAFGLGGPALASRGVELVGDLRASTALGVGEAGARAGSVLLAWRAVVRAARRVRPRAALLVNYTEFNARLAPRVLRRSIDRMAVMLPFEEAIWRAAGVDAHYVGHPALETPQLDRDAARQALGMTPYAAAVAVLPGSRPHEARRLLIPMLDAYERVRSDRASVDARVLVAAGLDDPTRRWVRAVCKARHVAMYDVDPCIGALGVLRAFDASLCASGTASLEAALAGAVPVVAYRVAVTTELAARLFLRAPHVALPNVLLGYRAFAELLQREARAERMADALADALDRRPALEEACRAVDAALVRGPLGTAAGETAGARTPSIAVARMLVPWLGVDARAA
jgi:lipid-A-disaccharide synthase